MKIKEQLHRSATHRNGYDPNCPQCLEQGIAGIIRHLESCAKQNERDAPAGSGVASEQRRMIGILKLYRKAKGEQA